VSAPAAIGIDLGGSKIELQGFDAGWQRTVRRRIATPRDYPALVAAIAGMAAAAGTAPVGIAAPGTLDPLNGRMRTANLPAGNRQLPADIAAVLGRPVTFLKDSQALALSEAGFGAARGATGAAVLILGTGIGGALISRGGLGPAPAGLAGEIGHIALPAPVVAAQSLPILACGCGRAGCYETLISGPGLTRLAALRTGRALAPEAIAAGRAREPALADLWTLWCALVAELVETLILAADPEIVVLAGGLSRVPGLVGDLDAALAGRHLPGSARPRLALAAGGDASGARGAALAARREAGHDG